jgi:hypothetical protein
MIIIILFILLLIYLLLNKTQKDNFIVYNLCSKSARVDNLEESNYGNNITLSIPLKPADEMADMKNGESTMKDGEIDIKNINFQCDEKNFSKLGFDPKDIKSLDTDIIENNGPHEFVDTVKLVPLLYNEIKRIQYLNFDNPVFYNEINDKVSKVETKINNLYDWYKKKAGLTKGNGASCNDDSECGGGGGYANPQGSCVNSICECNDGFVGKNCQNKDLSDNATKKKKNNSDKQEDTSCSSNSDCNEGKSCRYTKCQ